MPQYKLGPGRGLVCALAAVAIAGGCSDSQPPLLEPFPDGVYSVSDARNGGNPHFSFLPPLARPVAPAGDFDPAAEATVRVCVWDGGACVEDVAFFSTASPEPFAVAVDPVEERFTARWHTKDAHDGAGLNPANAYRIVVAVGGHVLGHADVRSTTGGRGLGSAYGRDAISLSGQDMVVIRFRSEEGAVPATLEPMIVAGAGHSCSLDAAGAAWCWGLNDDGQLGNGTTTSSSTPVAVSGGHVFRQITAGHFGTCALEPNGSGWCWGGGSTVPQSVGGGMAFSMISAGAFHTCAVAAADARAYCWGEGASGELGGESYTGSVAPRLVSATHTFTSLSVGAHHTCGMTTDGAVCWGRNAEGQLGRGTRTEAAPFGLANVMPAVPGTALVAIVAGGFHTCGVTDTGAAHCWGAGNFGQLGNGMPTTASTVPVPVSGGHLFERLTLGARHSCGVLESGASLCWGANDSGQLALGFPGPMMASPVSPYYAYEWADLDAGFEHACGISTAGELLCWGMNADGQLGDGSTMDRATPVQVGAP